MFPAEMIPEIGTPPCVDAAARMEEGHVKRMKSERSARSGSGSAGSCPAGAGSGPVPALLVLVGILAGAAVVSEVSARPGSQTRPSTQPFARTGPAVEASLGDLAWIAGRWEGLWSGTIMEEIWTDPKGGLILGLHRDVSSSGRATFEYLRIVEDDSGIAYLASPMGRQPTRFPLVEVDAVGYRAVFENPAHDFPRRITYWLGKDGKLHARVEGDQGGEQAAVEWAWSRREH